MAKNTAAGMSDSLITLLAQADKQRGFPEGTLFSVMQQETGGKQLYLQDPSTYHYGLNAEGKRIAGHTGKVSTAFGPFGILESTGRDPGYGVKPLQSKSLEEQVRFAGDYLAARSKQAGSLQAGLAGYGEGGKYGQQVMARLGKQSAPVKAPQAVPMQELPAVVTQAPELPVQQAMPVLAIPTVEQPIQMAAAPNPQVPMPDWLQFQNALPVAAPLNMDYSSPVPQPQVAKTQPNFTRFKSWMDKA